METILIIEDEHYLQASISELLHKKQYHTMLASTKAEAMQIILENRQIDLYLLDVGLPDGNGFEVCEMIRKRVVTPIIFLTACDDEESIVKGLDLGADDYITKPFRAAELLSRIQANLRRQQMTKAVNVFEAGELKVDTTRQIVTIQGRDLILRPVEYQLLCMFVTHAGVIVKREQLLDHLWDEEGNFIEDNTLSVHISRLRRKIGTDYIETVRGFGYRFTKQVREVLE